MGPDNIPKFGILGNVEQTTPRILRGIDAVVIKIESQYALFEVLAAGTGACAQIASNK